jgi:dCMP deaminase
MDNSTTFKKRPSFQEIYMNLALSLAERSTCSRLKVGCVIASEDFRHVYAVGYNGNASGMSNSCARPTEAGNCGCLHAEDNATVNNAAPRTAPKVVFVTAAPCEMCAKRLVNMGNVKKVYYAGSYRSNAGLLVLKECGIETELLAKE